MPFQIMRDDITNVKADAIVNTANPKPVFGSGTDGAIYEAAGKDKLLTERKQIGDIAPGDVAVTPAFALMAKYIIHTVGPAWDGGDKGEYDILKNCYRKSLNKAYELKCTSIAFPLIATGVYGFPKADALRIAMDEISSFLMRDDVDMSVKLVVFDDKAFRLSRNLFFQVESFITDNDVVEAHMKEYGLRGPEFERELREYRREEEEYRVGRNVRTGNTIFETDSLPFNEKTFDKSLYMSDGKDDLSFMNHLINLLIEKGIDNTVAYKRSNVTKGAFSKIMCGDTKKPQKRTVLGFCIGLKLNMEESERLLASADMAFNPYNKRDQLVIQCISRGQYNIDEVNAMLFTCHQLGLGND